MNNERNNALKIIGMIALSMIICVTIITIPQASSAVKIIFFGY